MWNHSKGITIETQIPVDPVFDETDYCGKVKKGPRVFIPWASLLTSNVRNPTLTTLSFGLPIHRVSFTSRDAVIFLGANHSKCILFHCEMPDQKDERTPEKCAF